jgi:hypothetical protein
MASCLQPDKVAAQFAMLTARLAKRWLDETPPAQFQLDQRTAHVTDAAAQGGGAQFIQVVLVTLTVWRGVVWHNRRARDSRGGSSHSSALQPPPHSPLPAARMPHTPIPRRGFWRRRPMNQRSMYQPRAVQHRQLLLHRQPRPSRRSQLQQVAPCPARESRPLPGLFLRPCRHFPSPRLPRRPSTA